MGDGAADLAAGDQQSFRLQEFAFAALNLLLIGAFFALQAISRLVRGKPFASVVIVLALLNLVLSTQSMHAIRATW
jgi:hypothetical protein